MRLVGYIRVSTEEQAREGRSLELQRADLHRFCGQFGHELTDVIVDDGVSASKPLAKRKGGAELVRRLEAGNVQGIVCTRPDRMFRIGLDAVTWGTWLRERAIPLFGTQEHIDLLSRSGWLTYWMVCGLAEAERLTIVERATETSQGLKQNAQPYGPIPFGLIGRGGKLYRDPKTWAVREEIMAMHRRRISAKGICLNLEDEGHPAPAGGVRWHVSTVRNIVKSHHELKHIGALPKRDEAAASQEGAR